MSDVILDAAEGRVAPARALLGRETAAALDAVPPQVKAFAAFHDFKGKAGQVLLAPGADGTLANVLFGLGTDPDAMTFRTLAGKLPSGTYRIKRAPDGFDPAQIALAFALGSYRFDRYKAHGGERAKLVCDADVLGGVDVAEARQVAHACALARAMV